MLLAQYKWVEATLRADSTINDGVGGQFYRDMAPSNATYPYCLIGLNSGFNNNAAKNYRLDDTYWLVRFVGEQSDYATQMRQWAELAYDALHNQQPGVVDSRFLVRVQFQSPIEYIERVNNVPFLHTGGIYRIEAS